MGSWGMWTEPRSVNVVKQAAQLQCCARGRPRERTAVLLVLPDLGQNQTEVIILREWGRLYPVMTDLKIYFTDAQAAALKRLSAEREVSVTELVRRAVDAYLKRLQAS